MIRYFFLVLALTIISSGPTPAYAVERGCKGKMYIKKGALELKLDDFSARGMDQSPDNARRKARAKLQDCAIMAKNLRWEHRKPDRCLPREGVFDYDIDSLKVMTERVACAVGREKGTMEVRLEGSGDKYCGFDDLIMTYDMTPQMCDILRTWEWDKDRQGSNFKNMDLVGADPGLCQKECNDDQKCKAWTYVKPGVQGTRARCWLKTRANFAASNNCCVSGVKGLEYRTDRPGADFKNFKVSERDPAVCQASCEKNSTCKAWTYVHGIQAHCWLKSKVPPARPNPDTISGVK
ncbi:MAG: PAN domain-containing protein [Nitrospira sp.]|nr:PAN domain-containing protein [Nitrospira sp.]MCW5782576.1 PAN domain-containing protein [Nitrospirales bacterium]